MAVEVAVGYAAAGVEILPENTRRRLTMLNCRIRMSLHLNLPPHPIPLVCEVRQEADEENDEEDHAPTPENSDEQKVLGVIPCLFCKY